MRKLNPRTWFRNGKKRELQRNIPRLGVRAGGLEGRLRSSFMDAMREYLQETSLKGINYASQMETNKTLRRIYVFIMVLLLVWGTCMLVHFTYDYQHRPPVQVQYVQGGPEFPVHFPAVGICSNSIVSKMQLEEYAAYLNKESNNATYDLVSIKENLAKFGSLVTLRSADVALLSFVQFLYDLDPAFNVTDLMYAISPKCSSMLSWCKWRGRHLPCEHLFATRLTPLGFCCLFNSRYHPEDEETPPKVLDLVGQNFGLMVAVRQNRDDFAFVRQPSTHGVAVFLFDGNEYPLMEGGAVRAYNVGVNESAFFQLSAHAQYATDQLKRLNANSRHCHLKQDLGPRSSKSSYSWCLAECRRKTSVAICNCQPFWYRPSASDPVCTPEHLTCLNKHREKFVYYYPTSLVHVSLAEELQDSLFCPECLPDCARVTHSAKVFTAVYFYPNKLFTNAPYSKLEVVNKSVLRFYYDSMSHHVYRVDLSHFWYEVFAAVSCHSLFLIGVSVISVAELVFHLVFRWGHHFARRTRLAVERARADNFH